MKFMVEGPAEFQPAVKLDCVCMCVQHVSQNLYFVTGSI